MSGRIEMRTPKDILGDCTCHEAYKGRKLTDPNCVLCNFGQDLQEALDAERQHQAKLEAENNFLKSEVGKFLMYPHPKELEQQLEQLKEENTTLLTRLSGITQYGSVDAAELERLREENALLKSKATVFDEMNKQRQELIVEKIYLKEENTRLLKSMGVWDVVKRKDEEIARLKKEISDRQGTEQSLTEWVDEIATSEDKLKTELAQLQLEVGALRGAIQKAADQIKRGEWNSYNSGTWTILNDVLSTPPLYSAVVELMNAGSYLCRRLANVSGGSDVEAEELWLKALSTLKKLMGRES